MVIIIFSIFSSVKGLGSGYFGKKINLLLVKNIDIEKQLVRNNLSNWNTAETNSLLWQIDSKTN